MESSEDLGASTSGPKYSKEYLSELKASTPSTPSNQKITSSTESDTPFDVGELAGAIVVDESMDLGTRRFSFVQSISHLITLLSGFGKMLHPKFPPNHPF